MSNNNDFNSNYEKAMLDWYNSTNSNENSNKSSDKPNYKAASVGIFGVIILVLFTIAFSHYIRTGTFINFSFKSMIDYLSTMPDVSLSFMSVDLTAYGDWGIFNFFRSIWNFLAQIFEVGITISGFITQAFVVIWFLLTMLFI